MSVESDNQWKWLSGQLNNLWLEISRLKDLVTQKVITIGGTSLTSLFNLKDVTGGADYSGGNVLRADGDSFESTRLGAGDSDTDTTNFNNKLSSADVDVQKALDTLDDHNHDLEYDPIGAASDAVDEHEEDFDHSLLHSQNTDTGTTSSTFQLDNDASGVIIKNNAGTLEARNAGDTAYAPFICESFNSETAQGLQGEFYDVTAINSIQIKSGDGTWWNEDWDYRIVQTAQNTGGAINDHIYSFYLDVDTLISQGYLQADLDDLRVINQNDDTELRHWLLPGKVGGHYEIFVEVDAWVGFQNIYVYFGNSSAGATAFKTSDIFNFYDRFETDGFPAWTLISGTKFDRSSTQKVEGSYSARGIDSHYMSRTVTQRTNNVFVFHLWGKSARPSNDNNIVLEFYEGATKLFDAGLNIAGGSSSPIPTYLINNGIRQTINISGLSQKWIKIVVIQASNKLYIYWYDISSSIINHIASIENLTLNDFVNGIDSIRFYSNGTGWDYVYGDLFLQSKHSPDFDIIATSDATDSDISYQFLVNSEGQITYGDWQGDTITVPKGGTGQTSYTDGQLLIGNSTGNTLAKATLTEGTGIAITNGSGSITIANDDTGSGAVGTHESTYDHIDPVFDSVTTPEIKGGTDASDTLKLESTSNATKGFVYVPEGDVFAVGVNTPEVGRSIHLRGQDPASGGASVLCERPSSLTDGFLTGVNIRHKTSGDMADGFGVALSATIMDSANEENVIGQITFERDGADKSGKISFRPSSTGSRLERMRIDNAGVLHINPGVGNSVSLEKNTSTLKISSNNYSGLLMNTAFYDPSSLATDIGGGIAFSATDGVTDNRWFSGLHGGKENATSGNYAGYLAFYTRANGASLSEAMRIDSTKNVGINTTSPGGRLHVVDSSATNTAVFERSGANSDTVWLSARIRATKTTTMGDNFGSGLYFQIADNSTTATNIAAIAGVRSGANNTGALVFLVANSGSNTERMRLDNNSKLWLGSGTAVDTNIYRSAANELKTDDSFIVDLNLTVNGNTTLGNASTDTITHTGRCILRTLGSDPQDATPSNRPAGSVAEIAYYPTDGNMYFCTDASTPAWKKITAS